MHWKALSQNIHAGKQKRDELKAVLASLRTQFSALCQEPAEGSDLSVLEELAQYIYNSKPDPDAISARLVELLKAAAPGTSSKFDRFIAMERSARSELESNMNAKQLEAYRHFAPQSLMDIDIDFDPFATQLEELVNALHPPPGFLCRSPFEYAHVQENGDVYCCCPSKFGGIIGNLTTHTLQEVWHSEAAQEVRNSILDGSYRFCNAAACEYLRSAIQKQQELSPAVLVQWAAKKDLINPLRSPKVINAASDHTCNLACSYCRKEMYKLTPSGRERIRVIDEHIFEHLSDDTERIVLLGEGDPFASPIYLEKLRHYNWSRHPKLKIKIQTNGLLLTPEMWNSIHHSHCVIDWINVSVDGATAPTYKINRGGDFEKLKRNLAFIANLRALQKISRFCISFLVQANNFREMPDFARLGLRLGCDQVEFQRIENWGTYTEDEYRVRAVHERWHPDNAALTEVLKDPILKKEQMWLLKLTPEAKHSDEIGIMSWNNYADKPEEVNS